MTIALKLENLTKYFGDYPAMESLNIEIKEGEIFGLLGPNGAGKTTTIKLISGLLKPSTGRIIIKGHDIVSEPTLAKEKFALLPDVPFVYEKLTGWEFMRFVSRLYKIEKPDLESEISDKLTQFGIYEQAHDLLDSYSHGQRQRLLFASVLLRDPEIIILDEPMVGLDPEAMKLVRGLLKQLAAEGKTIFLSTHTLRDAEELCSRVAIIDKGSLVTCGSILELKKFANDHKGDGAGVMPDDLEAIYLSITRNEKND